RVRARSKLRRSSSRRLSAGARLRFHLVALLGAVAPLRRDANRCDRSLLCRSLSAFIDLPSAVRDHRVADDGAGLAGRGGTWPRPGGHGVLPLGSCREAWRYPRARRVELRCANPVDSAADRVWIGATDRRLAAGSVARDGRCRPRFARDVETLSLRRFPAGRRQFEALELEGGRHRAADECPQPERTRRLPDMSRRDSLRQLANAEVTAQPQVPYLVAIVAQRQLERSAGVMMPDLVGIDAMPVRALACLQQKENRGAGTPRLVDGTKRLAIVAALGMRPQPEVGDDLVGREGHCVNLAAVLSP